MDEELAQLHDELNLMAQLIATRPMENWDQWVHHLLTSLDEIAAKRDESDEFAGVLDLIRRDIQTRLDLGRWQSAPIVDSV
jgi:truncated hemoglobin YjbI